MEEIAIVRKRSRLGPILLAILLLAVIVLAAIWLLAGNQSAADIGSIDIINFIRRDARGIA
jgi:hypothetical protein